MLVAAATAANAQGPAQVAGRAQYQAASDFDSPYAGGPPPLPPRGYYGAPPVYGPPAAYAQPPGYGPPPLLPPQEVYAVLRDNGFSPLGAPYQHGLTYVIAVIDRGGEDGRLVIDARNGRIIRFTPAFRWSNGYYGDRYDPPPPYGRPGVLPPMAPISGDARPTVPVPHMASRSVPLPQPKPSVAGRPPEVASQKSAAVQMKPEAPAPKPAVAAPATVQAAASSASAPAASAPAAEAKPTPAIAPTQPMPKAQGLE
jgi:hypothetical protein